MLLPAGDGVLHAGGESRVHLQQPLARPCSFLPVAGLWRCASSIEVRFARLDRHCRVSRTSKSDEVPRLNPIAGGSKKAGAAASANHFDKYQPTIATSTVTMMPIKLRDIFRRRCAASRLSLPRRLTFLFEKSDIQLAARAPCHEFHAQDRERISMREFNRGRKNSINTREMKNCDRRRRSRPPMASAE
jgi:hypothetical protein